MFVRSGFSLLRLQLAVNQNAAKVGEGVRFFTRGLRLLGSDVANGGQLFYRAALGEPGLPASLPSPLAGVWAWHDVTSNRLTRPTNVLYLLPCLPPCRATRWAGGDV